MSTKKTVQKTKQKDKIFNVSFCFKIESIANKIIVNKYAFYSR
jgi:hypothetical protein